MPDITFRELDTDELERMAEIDRAEEIDGMYTARNGELTLVPRTHSVKGWYPTEIPDHCAHIREMLAAGGAAFAAFDGDRLVGIVGLDPTPVGGDPAVLQLEPLNVSCNHRHRGIGTRLTRMVAARARQLGAQAIYISSIPTRNSVEAYMRMGARVLAEPDPALFAAQPEDIHPMLDIADLDVDGPVKREGAG